MLRKYILALALLTAAAAWLLYTPPGLLGKADAVGYSVCHQISTRTFHLLDRPLSLCARCTGQFLGAFTALVYLSLFGKRKAGWPPGVILFVLMILGAGYGVDALNSYLRLYPGIEPYTLYEPRNSLRLVTGIGLGISLGLLVWTLFQAVVWRDAEAGSPLAGRKRWGGLFLAEGMLAMMILTRNPLILYPLALLSAFSVVVLLSVLYTMIWVIVFKADNSFRKYRELTWYLAAGLLSAVIQIGLIDLLRYRLMGGWGGFPPG